MKAWSDGSQELLADLSRDAMPAGDVRCELCDRDTPRDDARDVEGLGWCCRWCAEEAVS